MNLSKQKLVLHFSGFRLKSRKYITLSGAIASAIQTLNSPTQTQSGKVESRQIVGVGVVEQIVGEATYTLYDPSTNRVLFQTVRYGRPNGFQILNQAKVVRSRQLQKVNNFYSQLSGVEPLKSFHNLFIFLGLSWYSIENEKIMKNNHDL